MKTDTRPQRAPWTPIAVVGMDCRFPGASDLAAYWRLLINGQHAAGEVPESRWDTTPLYSSDGRPGTVNTTTGHFIDQADAFDNEFFGIPPIEAAALDPQQRLALQTAWRAIEDAGMDPRSLAGTMTGVYAGVMSSEWSSLQMLDYSAITAFRGTGAGCFMVPNRISYHLNLIGPSLAIDTACSSSLTAIHQACIALQAGEIDLAIVVGVNLLLTPALSIFYTQAGLSAPDGRCKPFSADANGIGRGEGVGAVVLSRVADARQRRMPIYAEVAGSAANQDGRSNGITAPSRRAQAAVIERALAAGNVEPADIGFIEGHGTGTVLGDMIEVNALGDVHARHRSTPCYLGSVKGNIGHTEGAAGIAAFIKAVLSVQNKLVPPTLHGSQPNPALQLQRQQLAINNTPVPLDPCAKVGVSSFGLGGSNVHLIVQSHDDTETHGTAAPNASPDSSSRGIAVMSSNTMQGLQRNISGLLDYIETAPPELFPAIARTSAAVKANGRHRIVVYGDRSHCIDVLGDYASGLLDEKVVNSSPVSAARPRVGLLCTGQGAQYAGMTAGLYHNAGRYRAHLAEVCAQLNAAHDIPLDTPYTPESLLGTPQDASTLHAQPALFAISYALGRTLLDLGLEPAYLIGHSIGELAAAALADALTLGDAARIVRARAFLMAGLPLGGAMAAIGVSEAEARNLIRHHRFTGIAAVNAADAVVVAGPFDEIADVADKVIQSGGKHKNLAVSHAFHSPLMRPIIAKFKELIAGIEPRTPQLRLISTVRGGLPIGPDNPMDVEYWADQIVEPVRFADAVTAAVHTGPIDYLCELGPRTTLLGHARRSGIPVTVRSLIACDGPDSTGDELQTICARLLHDGFGPSTQPPDDQPGDLVRIPPYEFDTKARFWIEPRPAGAQHGTRPPAADTETTSDAASPAATSDSAASAPQPALAAELTALIADVGGYETHEIRPDLLLSEDLGYDSLIQLRLIDRLRTTYPSLADLDVAEILPDIKSVGDLVHLVTTELGKA